MAQLDVVLLFPAVFVEPLAVLVAVLVLDVEGAVELAAPDDMGAVVLSENPRTKPMSK